jgi:hypothetical protein
MGGFNAVLLTAYLVAMVALLTALLLVLAVLVTIVVNNNIGVGMLDHLLGCLGHDVWPLFGSLVSFDDLCCQADLIRNFAGLV